MLKQRAVEEIMIENRIKKLMNEDEKMRREIDKANKHTRLAIEVQHRRHAATKVKEYHKEVLERQRF